jgi:hypothetical protein
VLGEVALEIGAELERFLAEHTRGDEPPLG